MINNYWRRQDIQYIIDEVNEECSCFGYPKVNEQAIWTLPLEIIDQMADYYTAPLVDSMNCIQMDLNEDYFLGTLKKEPNNLSKYFYLWNLHKYRDRNISHAILINIETKEISLPNYTRKLTIEEYLKYDRSAPDRKSRCNADREAYEYWHKIFSGS